MKIISRIILLLLIAVEVVVTGTAQNKLPVTAKDCVTVRYLNNDGIYSPLQINNQGTRLAYVVKSPNLEQNRNDIQLYVKSLIPGSTDSGKLILVADTISQIHWAIDGEHIFALTTSKSNIAVSEIDAVTGNRLVVASGDSDIKEFTIDAADETIVFATDDNSGERVDRATDKQITEGYRIPFQAEGRTFFQQRHLFLTRRSIRGTWSAPQKIAVLSPLTGIKLTSFAFTPSLRLSISPNGKKLIFTYMISEQEELPVEWTQSLIGNMVINNGARPMTVLLVDLATMKATLPFKTAWAFSVPVWSSDSRSFALTATPPIGSTWEQADAQTHEDEASAGRLFWVEPDTGRIEEIARHVGNIIRGPLWWGTKGDMLVEAEDNTVIRLSHAGNVWNIIAKFRNPLDSNSRYTPAVSDGSDIIREHEGAVTPPELVWYRLDQPGVETFAKLDSQFDMLTLAPAKQVEWETSTGYKISGLLLVPPSYKDGQAYPLVIQGYHAIERFFCDSGNGHWPSLVPQPLANAGIMYLIRTSVDDEYRKEDRDHRPTQYPGGIGEAALQMDIWDSAIRTFATRGWIDPNHVGIIGFSRTGWLTEFTLTQSKMRYAAATDTDNVTYSIGSYWLFHSKGYMQAYDQMYGGPPYGDTLENWLKYSPAFNIDKIHTPVLMEEMGDGVRYENEMAPPLNLISHFELFTGLSRLNKPVELYYYPLESHTPEHPLARFESLQRNVDWYRFWLQGYERPNPEDPDQYKRWEHFRELQGSATNGVKSTGSTAQ